MAKGCLAHCNTAECDVKHRIVLAEQVLPKLKQKTKAVVYWGAGDPSDGDRKALKSAKVPLHSFPEFEKLGRDKPKDPVPPGPQDPCTIMYTRCGGPRLPSHSTISCGLN